MKIVVAADEANGIGKGGGLAWKIPEDMKRFRHLTTSVPPSGIEHVTLLPIVVMGRKTWDSIPAASRPLHGRVNFVITSGHKAMNDTNEHGPYLVGFPSFADVLAHLPFDRDPKLHERVWVVGGERVYRDAIASGLVTEIYLTRVRGNFGCDAFWPGVPAGWTRTFRAGPKGHSLLLGEPAYTFETWKPA